MSRTLAYAIDRSFKDRLHKRKKALHLTYKELAKATDMNVQKIKNIFNTTSNATKSISERDLNMLTQALDCTRDYLWGKSDKPNRTNNGTEIIHPASFKSRDVILTELDNYLTDDKHFSIAKTLHFLLCEWKNNDQKKFLEGLTASLHAIQSSAFYQLQAFAYEEDYTMLKNNLSLYNNTYTDLLVKQTKGRQKFLNGHIEDGTQKLLNVIKTALSSRCSDCIDIAKSSYRFLMKQQEEYPDIIPSAITKSLKNMAQLEFKNIPENDLNTFFKQYERYVKSLER